MVTIWACICLYFHEDRSDRSILLSTHLYMDSHWMTGTVCIELFCPCVSIIDRLSCYPSTVCCQIFNKDILLTAISTADSLLDYMDFVFWYLADPAYNSSYMIRNLGRSMDD